LVIAVCDTTPLNYLILSGYVDVLPNLFHEILIARAVARELRHPEAPVPVRRFISKPPNWVRILKASRVDPALSYLGTGEQEVIALALT
jgi:predicted nucleic acid-binding protein